MKKVQGVLILLLALSASATAGSSDSATSDPAQAAPVLEVLKASMKEKNGVGLDRLEQTDLQRACSNADDHPASGEQAAALREKAMASVVFPADGNYLGDWREGEKIAQNGRGMQYSDDPTKPSGGNCYACHQLDPAEIAAGTLGPSLTGYGQRGQSRAVLEYTWAKIWNPNASIVCSHMPRFGDAGILTPGQIRDLTALLLDPESPVNR
jgi:sulfur-oxidizing protein SoxX